MGRLIVAAPAAHRHVYCGAISGCPIRRQLRCSTSSAVGRRHRTQSLHRQVTDTRGNRWDVWEVDPRDLDRIAYDRRSRERNRELPPAGKGASWTPVDVTALHPELRDGWLCFQLGVERRRFAPVPPQWVDLPDNVLRVMLDVATPVTRTANPAADSGGTATSRNAIE